MDTMLNGIKEEDIDPKETKEWLDALEFVLDSDGPARARFLITQLISKSNLEISSLLVNTAYVNTIEVSEEAPYPGDLEIERRIRSYNRWNAMAIVVRAQWQDSSLGGHIGTFASSAMLYDIGINHFWRSDSGESSGDLVFVQGHSAPGIYARSFISGEISEEQLINFRQESIGTGLSSYPHPWLMPDYWQFATVSMGLGPIQAIYQARFMRYLDARGLANTSDRDVWCMCGDGEMDEPESLGSLAIAARERLDNLTFIVNCNLQRLDGPVRGNHKIIQELEGVFSGAGWHVIKVVWGSAWDKLLAKDKNGLLQQRMLDCVDGEYQNYKAHGGAYTRENFFGTSPELKNLVADMSDDEIYALKRGGHDPIKVYSALKAARDYKGKPVVILVKTVKGYGLGSAGEALNTAHNTKKLAIEQLLNFRDRFNIDISDDDAKDAKFIKFKKESAEYQYLSSQRKKLGGSFPKRRVTSSNKLKVPSLKSLSQFLEGSKDRSISTTMAFVRILNFLVKDRDIGKNCVPIICDEARTFGMEGLFRQLGIYSPSGQIYKPVDVKQVMYYKETKDGQVLQEGINEAGAFCSWLASATSYSVHNVYTIPFYIFYSMFGFQRIGDLAWLAGDSRAKGFLLGATSGRTTINGEGLQHEDGHSHIISATIPNCVSYDPAYSYELAIIIQSGLNRMYVQDESVFYYITLVNENWHHPAMPKGVEDGVVKGIYKLEANKLKSKASVEHGIISLLGSGAILSEVRAAGKLLLDDFAVGTCVYSVTSFNELYSDAIEQERYNRHNVGKKSKLSYVEEVLGSSTTIVAATDYIRAYSDKLARFLSADFISLGCDGFGRSDTRESLREYFEVNRYYVVYNTLVSLVKQGKMDKNVLSKAIKKYDLNFAEISPWLK